MSNSNEKKIFNMKMRKIKDIDEQNSTDDNRKSILAQKSSSKNKYLSNTVEFPKKIIPLTPISTKTQFKGFFNKKFNLTIYKNTRQKALLQSHSKEKIIIPHQLRGNGIPNDILERIKLLKKIFFSEKFQQYYKKRPTNRNTTTFESITEYIVNYRKKNSELESAMMAYYFICHEIKYMKNNENVKKKELKYSQKPEIVFETKRALSIGFTNFYEYLLKKMEIRFKHIQGNCKLIPKENSKFMINTNANINTNLNINVNMTISSGSPEKELKTESSYVNHCWDAIYINREWYFVDTLLGSGGTDLIEVKHINQEDGNNSDFDINFNPFYFMVFPQYFIMTHRPAEDLWQFTDKTITSKQFLTGSFDNYSQFYKGIFLNDIEFLTHNHPLIKVTSKDNLVIKLRVKNSLLGGDLYSSNGKDKLSEIKYSYEETTEIFTFEPNFPNVGDFIIRITSRTINSTDLVYWPLVDYIVKVQDNTNFSYFNKYKKKVRTVSGNKDNNKDVMLPKLNKTTNNNFYQPRIITDYMKIFPSKVNKKICYDDEGFNLIEPKTNFLKKGAYVKFKLRMKGVASIAILDGNQLFHLKKTERNIYEGEKQIKTDSVCICCLRGKNVFTEVYRFKQYKEKSVNSKMFLIKIKKRKI